MLHLTTSRRAVASLVLACHLLTATGCTSWQTQRGDVATVIAPPPRAGGNAVGGMPGFAPVPPGDSAKPNTVRRIRVTTSTPGTIELRNPRVLNDSLYGQMGKNGPQTGFALTDITSVKTKEISAGKTALLGVGVLAVTLGVMMAAVAIDCADAYFSC